MTAVQQQQHQANGNGRARLFSDADSETEDYYDRREPYSEIHMNGGTGSHGSKCECCPYGYHIDLDFVRYCENWQSVASDRIHRGNEEKRRRRARQKQCQSMEFMLGFGPADLAIIEKENNKPAPPAKKPTPPKPPPKPNLDSIRLNKDWQDSLSNFEQTLTQSFASSRSTTPTSNYQLSFQSPPTPRPSVTSPDYPSKPYQNGHAEVRRQQPEPPPRTSSKPFQYQPPLPPPPPPDSCTESEAEESSRSQPSPSLSSSRLVMLEERQRRGSNCSEEPANRVGELQCPAAIMAASTTERRTCLQSVREQMAGALERMRQLEDQVKEIPLLHVQMSVLREERRILLRQLAGQKKLNTREPEPTKRDVGVTCGVVTRDIGVSHQQTKTRETATEPVALEQCTRSTETPRTFRLDKGTQCFGAALERPTTPLLRSSRSVQSLAGEPMRTRSSSCSRSTQYEDSKKTDAGVQCKVEMREKSTASRECLVGLELQEHRPVSRRNKEVQATEVQSWTKLKLSTGVTAKPSVSDASTETTDTSINLIALRRGQFHSKSVGVNVNLNNKVQTVSRSTETAQQQRTAKRSRDFGTSPHRKHLADASVSASTTNYCDECKQASKSLSEKSAKTSVKTSAKTAKPKVDSARKPELMKTRIPVMLDAKSERRCNLIRQDTWTESLDQLGDGSQSLDKHADKNLVVADTTTSDKQQQSSNHNHRLAEEEDAAKPAMSAPEDSVRLAAAEEEKKAKQVEQEQQEEDARLDDNADADALVSSMILETPKMPVNRPPMELSKEMKAALKVLDDNLRNVSAGGTLPVRVKNASNIVQHEWFKVSSTAQADPLSVEYYLDQFEQHSSSLLHHVVNLVDTSGNTAMHYAVSHGNFDVVSILIDSKVCDVNRSNNAGYTPVMLAALAQVRNSTHASVVKRLFQIADVNVRARLHKQTSLMLAAAHARKDMSRLLLDAGAAINLQDEDGSTALMCAAEHGHAEIVRLLLSYPECDSSIVDVDGSSALKIALEAGHADIGVLLYAHQRANRASPMPGPCPSALPVPRPGKRQRTTSVQNHGSHHGLPSGQQYSALSMSAPASPVATASRKFHSSSLSLVDSPKFSL